MKISYLAYLVGVTILASGLENGYGVMGHDHEHSHDDHDHKNGSKEHEHKDGHVHEHGHDRSHGHDHDHHHDDDEDTPLLELIQEMLPFGAKEPADCCNPAGTKKLIKATMKALRADMIVAVLDKMLKPLPSWAQAVASTISISVVPIFFIYAINATFTGSG